MNPLLRVEVRDRETGEIDNVMYGMKAEIGSTVTMPMSLVVTRNPHAYEVYDFTKAQDVLITHAEEDK